jgi:uncharacterized protein
MDGTSSRGWNLKPSNAKRRFVSSMTTQAIQIKSLSAEDLTRVYVVLEQYADSQLDFTDAAIVTIAERMAITRVYTLDRRDL